MSDPESLPERLPRWGIVATMDEPAALVAAWVAHHLSIGAAQLHIFFDRPNPAAEALLGDIDRVFLHQSGEDAWQRINKGIRPTRHQARQAYNATRILNEAPLDWLIHCDADEFLRPSTPLAEELAQVDPAVEWLHLDVEERVWTGSEANADIFDGSFRARLSDFALIGPGLYGVDRAARMNSGLSGHDVGKACVRAGKGFILNIHRPASSRQVKRCDLRFRRCQSTILTHFNGMTRLQYIMKMLRRGVVLLDGLNSPSSRARKLQFEQALAGAGDPATLVQLWQQMQWISAEEVNQLSELDALRGTGSDDGIRTGAGIVAQTRALIGDKVDLAPAAFDRALVAHEAEALAGLHARLGFDPAPLMARDDRSNLIP